MGPTGSRYVASSTRHHGDQSGGNVRAQEMGVQVIASEQARRSMMSGNLPGPPMVPGFPISLWYFCPSVAQAVATWRDEAARLGLTREEVRRMASAFEHTDLEMALSFGG